MNNDHLLPALAGTAAAGFTALGCTIWRDTHRFVVRRYTVRSDRIRQDTRLVLLADLHDQVYGRHNQALLSAIDKEKPDLVISAGDLITAHHDPAHQRGEEATALLMTLARRYPTLAINGNHETKLDLRREACGYGSQYDDYEAMVAAAGGVLLRNEKALFADRGIEITGLELPLPYFRHFTRRPLPQKSLREWIGTPDPSRFNILIAHHPDYFPEYREWGADLVLSGHIHGGIIRLPLLGGVASPTCRLFPKYDGGRFDEEGGTLILSRGMGTHTIPVRLFNPGELVVVDCRRD
ncbi:MAG: metallophosphoesterase [Lachnospiraceae bacterium]|nr:metallophosphoesterase [Lachnospiraceae bacterium]